MKKKIFNATQLATIKRMVNNAFSEKGAAAADAIRALLDEMEAAEEEFDEAALIAKVMELVNKNEEVPEAVATEIENAIKAINDRVANAVNSGKKSESLNKQVKNSICAAILKARGKEEVKNAVERVLVANGITGLTFGDVVDYTIVENWGNLNPLFAQFHKTMYTKFFYNDDELETASILAKQWDKTGNAEKAIQALAVEGKTIATKYVYKRQQVAQEDLDEIEKDGEMSNLLTWLNAELDKQIVNTIVLAILKGDTINAVGQRVTTFESIASKSTDDVFTTILNPAGATLAISDLRMLADAVKNPYGKKKVMLMSNTTLSTVSAFQYGNGGSTFYHTKADLAAMVGVDEIITLDIVDSNDGLYAVAMLPDGYWYNEKKSIEVTYPTWEKNVTNYQKERNIGGAIHDLFSTAVLKEA